VQTLDAPRQALVLDDEFLIAVEIEAILTDAGYSVLSAVTVAEARDFAARNPVHVAVLDFRMEHGAHEFAHHLRAEGVPVVFCTGALMDEVHTVFPDAPVISKPFDVASLLGTVAGVLR
jgi:two-component system, response regulator PdtaR